MRCENRNSPDQLLDLPHGGSSESCVRPDGRRSCPGSRSSSQGRGRRRLSAWARRRDKDFDLRSTGPVIHHSHQGRWDRHTCADRAGSGQGQDNLATGTDHSGELCERRVSHQSVGQCGGEQLCQPLRHCSWQRTAGWQLSA